MNDPFVRPCPACGGNRVKLTTAKMAAVCADCGCQLIVDEDTLLRYVAREWNHFATHYPPDIPEEEEPVCESCKVSFEETHVN